MENFKKFELTAVWKKQVIGGGSHQAKIIKMADAAERLPEPTIYIFAQEEKQKVSHGTIWMNVPAMFRS